MDDFWYWLDRHLLSGLRASNWYDGQAPVGLPGYLNDKNSRMISYPVMRQIRVKDGKLMIILTCSLFTFKVKLNLF
jgi:hypothetical protein